MAEKLLILYASQTGNAQDVAERIGREALRRHYSPLVLSSDSCDPALLSLTKACVFVAATTGQGDPPDNMRSFWRFLLRKSLPAGCLQHLQYAVFGLGDSGYLKYNIVAKKLDRRLLDLGARPLVPRGLGDDQHPSGYEAALDPWLANFWCALRLVLPLPHGLSEPSDLDALILDPPKFKITLLSSPHCKLDTTLASKTSADECKGASDDALMGSSVEATAASANGDELEENLRAIAVLDAATNASSGVLSPADRGGMVKQADKRKGYSQANPYLATMAANVRLTSLENEQDVRHIELDLGDSGIAYEPGDVINVMPENSADVVARFCQRCGLDPDARVLIEPWNSAVERDLTDGSRQIEKTSNGQEHTESTVHSRELQDIQTHQKNGTDHRIGHSDGLEGASAFVNGHGPLKHLEETIGRMDPRGADKVLNGDAGSHSNLSESKTDAQAKARFGPVRIGALVRAALDVASASPRRYFFEVLSHFATAEHEIERLQYFATAEGRDDLYRYNQRERRTVLEVLDDFPSAILPLKWILQLVPRLKARAFSISSSLLAHPNQAHLTVAVVDFQTPYKRSRRGLCSHWLASLKPQPSKPVRLPVWVSRGFLRLPPPEVPIILVGPGTGCAPFRAFLEERTEGDSPPAPCLFFFGCRREQHDFLYRQQFLSYTADGGVLSEACGGGLSVAFSRDQMLKIYVTHRIKEQGRKIWQLIQAGASFFVAGSANKMPADVARALEIVAQREGQMSQQEATSWLKELERSKRYHVEAWS